MTMYLRYDAEDSFTPFARFSASNAAYSVVNTRALSLDLRALVGGALDPNYLDYAYQHARLMECL